MSKLDTIRNILQFVLIPDTLINIIHLYFIDPIELIYRQYKVICDIYSIDECTYISYMMGSTRYYTPIFDYTDEHSKGILKCRKDEHIISSRRDSHQLFIRETVYMTGKYVVKSLYTPQCTISQLL